MRKWFAILGATLLLSACASNKGEEPGASPQEYAQKIFGMRYGFVMSMVFVPSISGESDAVWGMKGLGVALGPFDHHCKLQQGQLKVSDKDRLQTHERSLPTKLQCYVSDALSWQVDIDYRNVQSEYVPMNSTTWVYMTLVPSVRTATQIAQDESASKLRSYRSSFKAIANSDLASRFAQKYANDDPEQLVPKALTLRQQLLEKEDLVRKEAQALKEREAREFDAYVKKRGAAVCSETSGTVDQPAGYAVMGQSQYRKVRSVISIRGSVEEVEGNRVQVRVSRIQAEPGGLLSRFDVGEAVLETGKVFWMDKGFWKKC